MIDFSHFDSLVDVALHFDIQDTALIGITGGSTQTKKGEFSFAVAGLEFNQQDSRSTRKRTPHKTHK